MHNVVYHERKRNKSKVEGGFRYVVYGPKTSVELHLSERLKIQKINPPCCV